MQKAFAAELLALIEGIKEMLGSSGELLGAEQIRRISKHYEASPATISLTLFNNNEISPEKAFELIQASSR